MITASRSPRKTGRIFRMALAASLLVHVIAVLLIVGSYDALDKLFPHRLRRPPPDETVAISTALHLEKRNRPVPSRASRNAPAAARRPHPAITPESRVGAARIAVTAHQPRPVRSRPHELARLEPRATPVPRPTAQPTTGARAVGFRRAAHTTHEPQHEARYSQSQLAAIENDLAQSIAHDRSAANPLSNVRRAVPPATSERRQTIDFSGIQGRRNGFEGLCEPIKSWPSGTYVYFYLTCRVTHEDGLVREEALPWPVRYPARRLSYDADGPLLPPGGPVAPPLPGWRPDPAERLDPDVISYLRKYGYPI